jgi:hypothetical protein
MFEQMQSHFATGVQTLIEQAAVAQTKSNKEIASLQNEVCAIYLIDDDECG